MKLSSFVLAANSFALRVHNSAMNSSLFLLPMVAIGAELDEAAVEDFAAVAIGAAPCAPAVFAL